MTSIKIGSTNEIWQKIINNKAKVTNTLVHLHPKLMYTQNKNDSQQQKFTQGAWVGVKKKELNTQDYEQCEKLKLIECIANEA